MQSDKYPYDLLNGKSPHTLLLFYSFVKYYKNIGGYYSLSGENDDWYSPFAQEDSLRYPVWQKLY